MRARVEKKNKGIKKKGESDRSTSSSRRMTNLVGPISCAYPYCVMADGVKFITCFDLVSSCRKNSVTNGEKNILAVLNVSILSVVADRGHTVF